MPEFDQSSFVYAKCLFDAGDLAYASASFERFLLDYPGHSQGWFLLGVTRHRLGDLSAARDAFQRGCALDAADIQLRFALARVCIDLGDHLTALEACRQVVVLAPADAQAWFSLAVVQESCADLNGALTGYDQALLLFPSLQVARQNRGALLLRMGRTGDALENNRALVAQWPFSFDAQFNLGESLLAVSAYREAAKTLSRALSLSPNNAKALLHAGFALAQCERFVEAQALLDRASELDPAQVRAYRQGIFSEAANAPECIHPSLDARTLYLLRLYDRLERCDWSERAFFLEKFAEFVRENDAPPLTERALGFRALAVGLEGAFQLNLARKIALGILSRIPVQERLRPEASTADCSARKIRLAYISPDFREHPSALLAGSIFSWHERSQFELTAYALGGDDGSLVRKKIMAEADAFIDLSALDDAQAAARIAADAVDILIDLAGYADQARPGILARRPAPIQISWLAYLTSMGAPWIDYLVSDRVSVPLVDSTCYSEALLRVPDGMFLCCYAGRDALPAPPSRASCGLPESGLVLGAMHNPYKIDPFTFSIWMRFLSIQQDAVLWLLDARDEVKANLRNAAQRAGLDPNRLIFAARVSHDEHLARLQWIDLALDTPQCNGGTTTADALVAGVPVLCCVGGTLTQRMAASLLSAARQYTLIVSGMDEYEKLGCELISNRAQLSRLRQQLHHARSTAPFFFPQLWLKNFERGLVQIWQMHCRGEAPRSIEVLL